MSANYCSENKTSREFEPLNSILFDQTEEGNSIDNGASPVSYRGYAGRRCKAALVLSVVWSGTISLHLLSWGFWLVLGLTSLLGLHILRLFLTTPKSASAKRSPNPQPDWPYVSMLVAAKNEEAAIAPLVKMLCNVDYPLGCYEVWIVDDNSTDGTPEVLDRLAREYDHLKILHRGVGASGGKSGALNEALPLTKGEILAVFDADARVSPDLLKRVLPQFDPPQVGAVQIRKAISNAEVNFWTRGQAAEMALDAFFQKQRYTLGGVGELRGNGQFVRRAALESCGYFNEETITDDLDLTLRLHLDGWDIDCISIPAVQEEGVTDVVALWHQRSRWAEGGYQRYLDYWRLMTRKRMGLTKMMDLSVFVITQYILPTAAIPDLLMAIARRQMPILSPLTSLTVVLSFLGMFIGLRQIHADDGKQPKIWNTLWQSLQGTLYMLHWFVVMASTTARIAVRPKRLRWVKTIHRGT